MYLVIWVVAFLATGAVLANTGQSPNAVSMSGQRRRRWGNIETMLGKWHLFADATKDTADPVLE